MAQRKRPALAHAPEPLAPALSTPTPPPWCLCFAPTPFPRTPRAPPRDALLQPGRYTGGYFTSCLSARARLIGMAAFHPPLPWTPSDPASTTSFVRAAQVPGNLVPLYTVGGPPPALLALLYGPFNERGCCPSKDPTVGIAVDPLMYTGIHIGPNTIVPFSLSWLTAGCVLPVGGRTRGPRYVCIMGESFNLGAQHHFNTSWLFCETFMDMPGFAMLPMRRMPIPLHAGAWFRDNSVSVME